MNEWSLYEKTLREEVEERIIGTVIACDNNMRMREIFKRHGIDDPFYFSSIVYREIFKCIQICWNNNRPADLLSVTNNKSDDLLGDADLCLKFDHYCILAAQKNITDVHIDHDLFLFKQWVLKDYWSFKSKDVLNNPWHTRDILMVSDNIINGYNNLYEKFTKNFISHQSADTIIDEARKKFERVKEGKTSGIQTGVEQLDNFSNGFQPSELTIIGARPGMGKTSASMALAEEMSYTFGRKGVFFSLEMTKVQLMNKIISNRTEIPYNDIKNYKLTDEQFQIVTEWYKWFDTQSNLKIVAHIQTLDGIVKWLRENLVEFAFIDYLQLVKLMAKIKLKAGNREQEVGEISKNLKAVAKELDIPIIALSQLSRGVEQRVNKRPLLSDLRESGSLEQDADNVIFLYRDAYYKEKDNANFPEIEKGNLEWIVAKGRETGTGKFNLHLDLATRKLTDYFKHHGMEGSFS